MRRPHSAATDASSFAAAWCRGAMARPPSLFATRRLHCLSLGLVDAFSFAAIAGRWTGRLEGGALALHLADLGELDRVHVRLDVGDEGLLGQGSQRVKAFTDGQAAMDLDV